VHTINLKVSTSYKQILSIALPISASIVLPQINFIINNIFLGSVNQQSLAAAGITGVYYLIFAVSGIGLNNGLQTLLSRRAGEDRVSEIGKLMAQSIRISFAMAAVGVIITWFLVPVMLRNTLHNQEIVEKCIGFLRIRIFGLFFLYLYQMRNALLVSTNLSRYLILGTAAEALVNVVFDYGLIKGRLGMPQLGFNGAAYASILADLSGLLMIYLVIRFKKIDKQLQLFKFSGFDWNHTRLILKQSLPLVAQHAISIISWEFFYILIEHHGETALAVSNTMRNIFGFFGCFTWAFAATTNSMVSNIIGQKKDKEVRGLIYKIIQLSFGFSFLVFIFLNLFPNVCLSIYSQGDEFILQAVPVVRIVSTALLLMSISVVWFNAVIGTGNSKFSLLIELMCISGYCIYVYIVLERLNLSIVWGWASEWIYWSTMLITSYLFMKYGNWHKKI